MVIQEKATSDQPLAPEHIPVRSVRSDRNMLKLLNMERFLIDRMDPFDRKALQGMTSKSGNRFSDAFISNLLMIDGFEPLDGNAL
ncbi:hypothetical protein MPC4_10155 [Methylocella tundrae]|uniref:Uncharacterized protein n=1 Tax=Methylocella tundrae TaxID=227605 RepID=A0A8B6M0H4_METTU|nr:hypothetical protein MPC4_10155 [Methylocella tundrae]